MEAEAADGRIATNVHEIAHAYCGLNIFRHANENGLKLDMNKAEEFFTVLPTNRFSSLFPLNHYSHPGSLKL
jgi:hypothetical protein